MSFPNFAGKHAHDAMVNPQEYVLYSQRGGHIPADLVVPDSMIFCYQQRLARDMVMNYANEPLKGLPCKCFVLTQPGGTVGVCMGFGVGAPAATMVMELCIALGVRRFMSIGTAGTLQTHCAVGSIVVCNRAIRDEGVSHHYLPAVPTIEASPNLTGTFAATLTAQGVTPATGTTWTIDAPYRETVAEARHYQQQGVLTVEMEAAALFAVAQVRGVEITSGFVISDSLADFAWDPQFQSEAVADGYRPLFRAACDALLR